jgi:hypothetical protein
MFWRWFFPEDKGMEEDTTQQDQIKLLEELLVRWMLMTPHHNNATSVCQGCRLTAETVEALKC